jgi:hypothetical protein
VWLHGGALTRGSSAVPVYDGRTFARDGVVFVSVNYRLGVEGYGLFPDAPVNPGLRDQLAALRWVHESIAAFGGDQDRITLAGQSAGAISTGALLAAPQAQGLVRRAVLQSGRPEAFERDKARRMVRRMATRLRIPATAAAFAEVDRDLLLRTQADVGRLSSPVLGGPSFGIVVDGDLVPRDPLQALVDGDAAKDVDLMLGWTSDEYRLWLVPGGLVERVDRLGAIALAGAMARCHCGTEVPRGYRALHPDAGTAEIVGQMITDHLLRIPLHRLADANLARLRVRLALQPPRPRRLPRPRTRLRLRHRRPTGIAETGRRGRPARAGRGDALGVGAVRRRRGPRLAALGRHPSGADHRRGPAAHNPRPARRRAGAVGGRRPHTSGIHTHIGPGRRFAHARFGTAVSRTTSSAPRIRPSAVTFRGETVFRARELRKRGVCRQGGGYCSAAATESRTTTCVPSSRCSFGASGVRPRAVRTARRPSSS